MFEVCLWVILVMLGQAPPSSPAPPRDPASRDGVEKPGTATVRGRVTDRETGQPLGRVEVVLISSAWREQAMASEALISQTGIANDGGGRPNRPRNTVTGADGRFEFKHIQPGAYIVSFYSSTSRATHLDQSFGESGPRDPSKPSRAKPIELRDGETRENINVALSRAFAFDARVVDDTGEPIANVEVTIGQWDGPSTMSTGMPRFTDDRGMFRFFGLRPGQYRICAESRMFFEPDAESQDRLIRTCYPSAVSDGGAQPVVVSSAEVGPIEIQMQRNRTYRITGMVIDSTGAAVRDPSVGVMSITPNGSSSSGSGIEVKPDGRFSATGVTPGEYGIQVGAGNWDFSNRDDKRDREIGYLTVRVDGADIDGVVVSTSKTAKVAGRIVFEGTAPEPGTSKLSIMATMDDFIGRGPSMMWGPPNPAVVRDDMTFELDGLFGLRVLRVVGPPRGWIVKSVKYRGDDVTETGVEFKSSTDPKLLEVTLTNQVAIVTGRVLDDDGNPSPDAYVFMLPADVTRWRPFPGSPMIAPKEDGTFTIGPVRAGEYIIGAATGISTTRLLDPAARTEFAQRIAKIGERIVLAENDKRSIDLRMTKLQ